jgi:hypothetical protein
MIHFISKELAPQIGEFKALSAKQVNRDRGHGSSLYVCFLGYLLTNMHPHYIAWVSVQVEG